MGVFLILMWKHYMVRKRRWIQTIIEIAMPVSLTLVFYLLKDGILRKTGYKVRSLDNYNEDFSPYKLELSEYPYRIVFAPDTFFTRQIMDGISEYVGKQKVMGMNSTTNQEDDRLIDQWFVNGTLQEPIEYDEYTRVDFYLENRNNESDKLDYDLNIKASPLAVHRRVLASDVKKMLLVRLQWALDSRFLEVKTGSKMQNVSLIAFRTIDEPLTYIASAHYITIVYLLIPYISFAACHLPFIFLMNRLLEEKATGIQELVKMEGISQTMMAAAQLLNTMPTVLIFSILGTYFFTSDKVPLVAGFNKFIFFLCLFLHFMTMIAMAFPCSYIIRDAQCTVALSMFSYVGLWVPVRLWGHEGASNATLFFKGLLPHCPHYWVIFEGLGVEIFHRTIKIDWDTFHKQYHSYPKNLKNGSVMLSLIMQCLQLLYMFILFWYLHKVRPGKYGVALPWNFLFRKEYWIHQPPIQEIKKEVPLDHDPESAKFFEHAPSNLEAGVRIVHVSKIFGSGAKAFQALNDVSFDIYKGEITVLLGHNGAGKTTLMSIITGMISPTSGKVFVNGFDTVMQSHEIKRHLGLCPQHNLFFPDLTVHEHLLFFSLIKGNSCKVAKEESQDLMERLNLVKQAKNKTGELSGGMLRRLQLGCALCGDSKVLILDEPTSGLDVEARRELWDMLLNLRGDRAMVLTTHFMQEADVLGDRLVALHKGKLRSYGTPLFMKRAVGSGFRISITTKGHADVGNLTSAIQGVVPNVAVQEATKKTVVFDLPDNTDMTALFKLVESQKEKLDIESISVGITSLEEVFIELCCDTEEEKIDLGTMEVAPLHYRSHLMTMVYQFLYLLKRQYDFTKSRFLLFLVLHIILPFLLTSTMTKLFNNNPHEKVRLLLLSDVVASEDVAYNIDGNYIPSATIDAVQATYNASLRRYGHGIKTALRSKYPNFERHKIAIEVNQTDALLFYDPDTELCADAGINLLSNILAAKLLTPFSNNSGRTTSKDVQNNVINRRQGGANKQHQYMLPKTKSHSSMFAIFNMCILMSITVNDVSLPCIERLTVARHTHIMAGCPPPLYWLATFLYHIILFSIVTVCSICIAMKNFDYDSTYSDIDSMIAISVVFVCNGMNFYAFTYIVSFFVDDRAASLFLIALVLIFGFFSQILITALDDLKQGSQDPVYTRIMKKLGLFIPPHLYADALLKAVETSRRNQYCVTNLYFCPNLRYEFADYDTAKCCATKAAPYKHLSTGKHSVGSELRYIMFQFLVFAMIIMLLQYGIFNKVWLMLYQHIKLDYPPKIYNAPAIVDEKKYVEQSFKNRHMSHMSMNDALLVYELSKTYNLCKKKKVFALHDINFSVKKGECFGIVGVNGAGKTTTFKLIVKKEDANRGIVYANNYLWGRRGYMKTLGYCPQFCGLDFFRTGRANMRLLLVLRGLQTEDVMRESKAWLDVVGMTKYSHRKVSGYSGGMVRRLATTASLCGGAPTTLLDEPTAGVDTAARRLVWTALMKGQQQNRTIVFASQSMDEIEKLCARIVILHRGEMAALGTPTTLKSEYATGYSVMLKISADNVQTPEGKRRLEELKNKMHDTFEIATLKDEHLTSLQYFIGDAIEYSDIFGKIKAILAEFKDIAEDYEVTGTTIEDVFLAVNALYETKLQEVEMQKHL